MARRQSATASLLLFVLVFAGCASAPLSFVEGVPQTRTDPTLYPLRVVSVDGSIKFAGPSSPVQVLPGPRWIVLEAAPGRGAFGSLQKSFLFKVEPCSHYYLAAKRSSPMDKDWSLIVDKKELVGACIAEEELKKAGLAAEAGGAASAGSHPQ